MAFIQEGSGRPIIRATCFFVNNNKSVAKIDEFNPSINNTALNISPKTCKAATPSIEEVKTQQESSLMSVPGVVGVGIGECNGRPCLTVYLEKETPESKTIPTEIEGFKVGKEVTGQITAQ